MTNVTEGLAYTRNSSFRARAEAQQRRYRASVLKVDSGRFGHLLCEAAAKQGANFLFPPLVLRAIEGRTQLGKGIDERRTYSNMLSSQAMCFNIFAPLGRDKDSKDFAVRVLARFIPQMAAITAIELEYTPGTDPGTDLFGDQTGRSGVDCDVLIRYCTATGATGLLTIETKFVEPEFSSCGFRKRRSVKLAEQARCCRSDIVLSQDCSNCLYTSRRKYRYWERTLALGTLNMDAVRQDGCPFGGPLWQLWVNHTLVHAEAKRIGAVGATFAVCAPKHNDALLCGGATLAKFGQYLDHAESFVFIPLEELIGSLQAHAHKGTEWQTWADALRARYVIG